jgi:hypothetical protein
MIQVRDGSRILQFEGRLIAQSSSWRRGSYRWVEFHLYRVTSGVYVLARVGMSLLYHVPECDVVYRNNLKPAPRADLDRDARPCDRCMPDRARTDTICPEKPRYWAQVCETPEAVLDALYKFDDAGSKYLTLVAQRLLDEASDEDESISQVYRIETIS